jgi:ergothioneine biosynthesis protein EgtB
MERQALLDRYRETRELSVGLCRPLKPEDFRIQSMPDVSPPWWNLGHTSWFFAKNILEPFGRYHADDSRLEYALNSYYESLGPRLARDHRGLVTRPTTAEVYSFRASVDERLAALIGEAPEEDLERLGFLVQTGIQHEQQHQELLVTEIKHILGSNIPELREPYLARAGSAPPANAAAAAPAKRGGGPAGGAGGALANRRHEASFVAFGAGLHSFGNVEGGWCWDNELPVHAAYLADFALADRLVTNGEYLEFMAAGGYSDPLLWLANGWARVRDAGWEAPLYWERDGGRWRIWTLSGLRDLDLDEPVCHVSFYEAEAFARHTARRGGDHAGTRLPTEREWEHAARLAGFPGRPGNFLDTAVLHPLAAAPFPSRPGIGANGAVLQQMGGDVWEWTTNHYEPYPGYQPFAGALMEYNGKFMDNQRVLRGGSCATPANHIRPSYRNFWPADTRFQFTGIRLARTPK